MGPMIIDKLVELVCRCSSCRWRIAVARLRKLSLTAPRTE